MSSMRTSVGVTVPGHPATRRSASVLLPVPLEPSMRMTGVGVRASAPRSDSTISAGRSGEDKLPAPSEHGDGDRDCRDEHSDQDEHNFAATEARETRPATGGVGAEALG